MRTRLNNQLGGYRKELPHSGDLEMWLRFAAHACVGILDADQAYYRVHGQNMSIRQFGNPLAELEQRKAAFDTFFLEYAQITDRQQLQRLANAGIARMALWGAYKDFYQSDIASCRRLAEFAHSVYPQAQHWPLYLRIAWMLRLGPRRWSTLRKLMLRKPLSPSA
jgi:hypothetical protein